MATASNLASQRKNIARRYQGLLDSVTPLTTQRWIGTAVLLLLFITRILYIQAFYIVTYALGIYLLNLLLAFLSPKFDPSLEMADVSTSGSAEDAEEGSLPTRGDEEFKPFVRRLPEFKFWYSTTRGTFLSLIATFFDIFDVPVFWPILVLYFIILFTITMKRQIKHMLKHKYIPFDLGKKTYNSAAKSSK